MDSVLNTCAVQRVRAWAGLRIEAAPPAARSGMCASTSTAAADSAHLVIPKGPAHLLAADVLVQGHFTHGFVAGYHLGRPLNDFPVAERPASIHAMRATNFGSAQLRPQEWEAIARQLREDPKMLACSAAALAH